MKCKYCEQDAEHKPIAKLEAVKAHVYWCDTCSAEIILWEKSKRLSHSLYVVINNRTFRWTIYTDENATHTDENDFASLWRIGKPGIPGVSVNEDVKLIATFGGDGSKAVSDIIPEITPKNIKDKLSVYLVFL